jgi:hypothetical protein
MATTHSVFAIYNSRIEAEDAVDMLVQNGVPVAYVSALLQTGASSRDFAHEKHTKAPEGATAGAAAGGAVGGTLGLLSGLGALAIPGIGPLIAAGPIVATLAGLGAGGAIGGLIGALSGMGIPEYEAKRYEGRVNKGGVLLSVHCETSDEIDLAKKILKRAGGEDIASAGEEKPYRDYDERRDSTSHSDRP